MQKQAEVFQTQEVHTLPCPKNGIKTQYPVRVEKTNSTDLCHKSKEKEITWHIYENTYVSSGLNTHHNTTY